MPEPRGLFQRYCIRCNLVTSPGEDFTGKCVNCGWDLVAVDAAALIVAFGRKLDVGQRNDAVKETKG